MAAPRQGTAKRPMVSRSAPDERAPVPSRPTAGPSDKPSSYVPEGVAGALPQGGRCWTAPCSAARRNGKPSVKSNIARRIPGARQHELDSMLSRQLAGRLGRRHSRPSKPMPRASPRVIPSGKVLNAIAPRRCRGCSAGSADLAPSTKTLTSRVAPSFEADKLRRDATSTSACASMAWARSSTV